MKIKTRIFTLLFVLLIIAITTYNVLHPARQLAEVSYSTFLSRLEKGEIVKVHLQGGRLTATNHRNEEFTSFAPHVATLLPRLAAKKVTVSAGPDPEGAGSTVWVVAFALLIFMVLSLLFFARRSGGDGGFLSKDGPIAPFQSRHPVRFADVAGVPEIKEDLAEIVDILKNPGQSARLGGRIPRGVLLQGPPGTGKTLLAKAIAGEAQVPFFSISGSDFVEMFVGVGASRVRDLFKQAKKNAPCIVFIDEIDAVGKSRGSGGDSGGQGEYDQTLNALLVEMDGFQSNDTVIIIGATNRPDILDPALLRPGRFDRQINLLPPDLGGREKILRLYTANVIIAPEVDLHKLARSTPGFTGAELANLINEAALLAARKGKDRIETVDIDEARDKILMGAERKGMVISSGEKKTTAYHEAGHAIMALLLPGTDPLYKITIIPRGRAMGVTQQVPLDERHAYSKEYLENRIKTLLGGRTAEEIIFNKFSSGASNDLQAATEIATRMVCEWGMSEQLGPRAYTRPSEGFLGTAGRRLLYGEETAAAIDREIDHLMGNCYQEAMIILEGKLDLLHLLAGQLLEKETLGPEAIRAIVTPGLDSSARTGWEKRAEKIA